jgi:hypothetical protein
MDETQTGRELQNYFRISKNEFAYFDVLTFFDLNQVIPVQAPAPEKLDVRGFFI